MSMSVNRRVKKTEATSFPQMTNAEICDCLSYLNINVPIEDIVKPTPQSAQTIYTALLDVLMGANMEMIEGPKATLLGMMEYKELYGDALQFTMFFRHCRELAKVCGIHNFSMNDLTRPDGQRFRSHLSGVLNFAKFHGEREAFQGELSRKLREQKEQVGILEERLENVEATIEEITLKNAQDKPLMEESKKKNDGLRAELLSLRSEQMQLSYQVEELKKERQAVMEQAASKQQELVTLTTATNTARSRLVQSPDRIKKLISEMSATVTGEKANLANIQNKTRDLANRLEVIGGLETDLKGLIELERGIEEQKSKVEEMKRKEMQVKASIEGKRIESDGLKARHDQLDRQYANAKDKLQRQQVALEEMRTRTNARMEVLKSTYVTQNKERSIWLKKIQRIQAEQKALDDEMAEFTATHEAELNQLLSQYWAMRRQAEDYMKTINQELRLDVDALKA